MTDWVSLQGELMPGVPGWQTVARGPNPAQDQGWFLHF